MSLLKALEDGQLRLHPSTGDFSCSNVVSRLCQQPSRALRCRYLTILSSDPMITLESFSANAIVSALLSAKF